MSERTMDNELYDAAIKGDVSFLTNSAHDEEYFHSQTCQGDGYLHIAIQGQHYDFIEVALKGYPGQNDGIDKLLRHQNCDGNTPLHIAAEVGNIDVLNLLLEFRGAGHHDTGELWRVKNNDGNTPLHVALMYLNYKVAETLLSKIHGPHQLVRDVNNSEETPLHLAIKYTTLGDNVELVNIIEILHEKQLSSIKGLLQGTHLLPMIELLLQKDISVACLRDTNGLTPLLRAASLEAPYDLKVIKLILHHHPQSAKVCDHSGKTILHHINRKLSYQEAQELLGFAEAQSLVNYRDCNGDTPAHVAVGKGDMNFVRILLDFSARFLLKNHAGVSAADLLKQKTGISKAFVEGISELTNEDRRALRDFDEEYLNGKLASKGKVFLLSRLPDDGSNILHILIKSWSWSNTQMIWYVKEILEMYPDLLWQTDHRGYTPAHSLASHSWLIISGLKQLQELQGFEELVELVDVFDECHKRVGRFSSPWRERNEDGDTPLLVSLKSMHSTNEMKPALILWKKTLEEASFVRNNRGETAFHLLADLEEASSGEELRELKKFLLPYDRDRLEYFLRQPDVNGLSAFERAVQSHRTNLIHLYCKLVPRVIFEQFRDDKNTVLHIALEKSHFGYAKLYVLTAAKLDGDKRNNQQKLLEVSNSKGVTPADLIGSLEHLPSHFEKFLWKEGLLAGRRSMYGVPMVKIGAYTSTIGVIAALLATVSFTAGFTVPGGTKNDDGTPVLLKKAAFQVFMVSNSLALCFSMMVLFCLLWIMATQNKKESILLVDTSILLLELSFYSTLLTFMTGVYVTTINITPWMAILPCALCSLLIMLMHRWFIKDYLGPFCMRSIMCYTQLKNIVKEKVLDKIFKWFPSKKIIFKWFTQLCNSREDNNADEESS